MAKLTLKQVFFIVVTAIVLTAVTAATAGVGTGAVGLTYGQAGFWGAFWKTVAINTAAQIGIALLAQELFDEDAPSQSRDDRNSNVRAQIAPARWRFGRIMADAQPIWYDPKGTNALHRILPLSNGEIERLVMMISTTHSFHVPLLRGVHVILPKWSDAHGSRIERRRVCRLPANDAEDGVGYPGYDSGYICEMRDVTVYTRLAGNGIPNAQGPGSFIKLPHSHKIGVSTLRSFPSGFSRRRGRNLLGMGAFVRGTNTRVDDSTKWSGFPGPMPLVQVQECFRDIDKPVGPQVGRTNRWRNQLRGGELSPMVDWELWSYNTNGFQFESGFAIGAKAQTGHMRWGPENVGYGVSYVHEKLVQSDSHGGGGWYGGGLAWSGPPRFRYLIDGIKIPDGLIIDHASHSTPTIPPPRYGPDGRRLLIRRPAYTDVWAYHQGFTKNPALLRAYFLIDRMGIDPSKIDRAALQEAIDICDETVVFHASAATLSWFDYERHYRQLNPNKLLKDVVSDSATTAAMADEDNYRYVQQYSGGGKRSLIRLYRSVSMSGPTMLAARVPNRASDDGSQSQVTFTGTKNEVNAGKELVEQIRNSGQWPIDDVNSGWVGLCYVTPTDWGLGLDIDTQPGQARLHNGEIWVHPAALPSGYWTTERRASSPDVEAGWEKLGGDGAYHVEVPYGTEVEWLEEMPGISKRYEAHGEIVAGESLLGPFRQLDRAMDGWTTLRDGKYYIRAGRRERLDTTIPEPTPVLTSTGVQLPPGVSAVIRDSDLVNDGLGDVQVGPAWQNEFTGASFSLIQDEFRNWRAREFKLYDEAREREFGERLESRRKIRFDYITNPMQARQIGTAFLIDARKAMRVAVQTRAFAGSAGAELVELAPGDVVLLQLTELGWEEGEAGHRMQIQTVELDNEDFSLTMDLVTQERGNTKFFFELPELPEDEPLLLPIVTVSAVSASVPEGSNVVFRFTRSGVTDNELPVRILVSDPDGIINRRVLVQAAEGPLPEIYEDLPIPNEIVIPAGEASVDVPFGTLDHILREDGEVSVELQARDGGFERARRNSQSYHIGDSGTASVAVNFVKTPQTVTIEALDARVPEGREIGFVLTRAGDGGRDEIDVPVTITEGASALDIVPTSVTIPAGQDLGYFVSYTEPDGLINAADRRVTMTLGSPPNGAGWFLGTTTTATVSLADADAPVTSVTTYEVAFGDRNYFPNGREHAAPGDDVTLRVDTDSAPYDEAQTITLTLGGTAALGDDYSLRDLDGNDITSSPYTFQVPPGASGAFFDVVSEPSIHGKTIVASATHTVAGLTLPVPLGSATINYGVSVRVEHPQRSQLLPGDDLVFRIVRSANSVGDLSVGFTVTQDGVESVTPSPVEFTGSERYKDVTVRISDTPITENFNVTLTLDHGGTGWVRSNFAYLAVATVIAQLSSVSIALLPGALPPIPSDVLQARITRSPELLQLGGENAEFLYRIDDPDGALVNALQGLYVGYFERWSRRFDLNLAVNYWDDVDDVRTVTITLLPSPAHSFAVGTPSSLEVDIAPTALTPSN